MDEKHIMKGAPEVMEMVEKAYKLIGSPFYINFFQEYELPECQSATGLLECLLQQMQQPDKMAEFTKYPEELHALVKIFMTADKSVDSRHLLLKETLASVNGPKRLNQVGKLISELLEDCGQTILSRDPEIFLEMVKQAHRLIPSPFYLQIIQKMAELYKTIPERSHHGHLQCLMKQFDEQYDANDNNDNDNDYGDDHDDGDDHDLDCSKDVDNDDSSQTFYSPFFLPGTAFVSRDQDDDFGFTKPGDYEEHDDPYDEDHGEMLEKLLSVIQILLTVDGSAKSRCLKLEKTISTIQVEEDLDLQGKEFLGLLEEECGWNALSSEPALFLEMIEKAHCLIGNPIYLEIVQKMTGIYDTIHCKLSDGPLQCLIEQMCRTTYMENFAKHQQNFLLLIKKLLLEEDSLNARTVCLVTLLENSEFINVKGFVLTHQFMEIVKLLIQHGADPAFALDFIFRRIPFILSERTDIVKQLFELLPLILTGEVLNHKEPQGTVLHVLLSCNWEKLPEDLTTNIFEIICKIVEANPALLDVTDENGHTVLHCFVLRISKNAQEATLFQLPYKLKSPSNIDMQDEDGQTVLHILAKRVSDIGQWAFLELVNSLKSSRNVDMKDIHGQTPFQVLAGSISEIGNEAFLTCLHCFASSNIDIQDNQGQTVLHYLAERISAIHHENLFDIFSSLRPYCNTDIQDNHGQTVLHILAERASEVDHENFVEVVKCLKSPSNISIQDDQGQTVLHILANALYRHPVSETLTNLFPALVSQDNVNVLDQNSLTPYTWILMGKEMLENNDIFSITEELFLSKGADAELASESYK